MADMTFTTRTSAELVLESPDFAPPPGPSSLVGPMADLRTEMARFSSAEDHEDRRAAVEGAVDSLANYPFAEEAARRTLKLLEGEQVDALADLGFVVPTQTLLAALGTCVDYPDGLDLDAVRTDVRLVVEVIGRQQPATQAANEAVLRLRRLFRDHAEGSTAAISLLYQNHDATAALLASSLIAAHEGVPRRSALARTVRVAAGPVVIDQTEVPAGATVVLDLEAAGLEFGAGPHECPGQAIAKEIVSGIGSAIASAAYVLVPDEVELGPDGRPVKLPMKSG